MKNNHPSKKQQHPSKKVPQQAVAQERAEAFPEKVPFWARLKFAKNRTTLVIDRVDDALNKSTGKREKGFVHREAIHPNDDYSNIRDYEKVEPNPDKDDDKPMYLKRPKKTPERLFRPHNKNLSMPEQLKQRYEKNNNK